MKKIFFSIIVALALTMVSSYSIARSFKISIPIPRANEITITKEEVGGHPVYDWTSTIHMSTGKTLELGTHFENGWWATLNDKSSTKNAKYVEVVSDLYKSGSYALSLIYADNYNFEPPEGMMVSKHESINPFDVCKKPDSLTCRINSGDPKPFKVNEPFMTVVMLTNGPAVINCNCND